MSDNSRFVLGRTWLKPISVNTLFVLSASGALLLIGGGIYWTQFRPEPRVNLMAGARLLEQDLGRMQLAFGGAGLNDFEVRDGQIFVPQGQRDRFLKALNDYGGVPEASREMYEPAALNPWATSVEVQESNLLRKKRMIRQLVLQLEFVADAVVDYDELNDAGWPPTTHRSAAVVVRPKSSRLLESHQIEAIRNTICGAVAGLTPADIVITDIAAGHAYVGPSADLSQPTGHDLEWLERAKLEQRIRDQLLPFGDGIEVHVTIRNGEPSGETNAMSPPTIIKTVRPSAPLANQPTSLDPTPANSESGTAIEDTKSPTGDQRTMVVAIRVAEPCVREFAQSLGGGAESERTLEQQFQLLQTQVKDAVQPLLTGSSPEWPRHRIVVTMARLSRAAPAAATPSASPDWSVWRRFLPAAGVVMVTVALLALSLIRRPTALPRVEADNDFARTEGHDERESRRARASAQPIPDETKRKLRQMVDDDPDQAAEIIKQWIRGAA